MTGKIELQPADVYRDRLEKLCKRRYDELTAGKTEHEILYDLEGIIEKEADPWFKQTIIARNMNEASALVDQLENSHLDDSFQPEKLYEIIHQLSYDEMIEAVKRKADTKKIVSKSYTRSQILDRLRWISSDDFGDNPDAWRAWYEAWKIDPPIMGYR